MRFVMFYHTLVSDWNHGNAHFLRGVATELLARGHRVVILEPRDSWSRANLLAEAGPTAIDRFHRAYPTLTSVRYGPDELDLDRLLAGTDVVLVHEWNDPALVAAIGRHRAVSGGYRLFFHDTHHRSVSRPEEMEAYELEHYDGVLAFGDVIRRRYVEMGWTKRAWTWHEAADHRVFRPIESRRLDGDLVWIGNWGDDERTTELEEFLLEPAASLGLRIRMHGVRYPAAAVERLERAGVEYSGWTPNFNVPAVFARFRATVHIPRRPYVEALPGIPTIRVFEALACGMPLLSAPWDDAEGLFTAGRDYLMARDGGEMRRMMRELMSDERAARALADHGRRTILARHTCVHRVDELLRIAATLEPAPAGRSA
ncbi:MAG: glycosyltransferase [Gemmatimonadales bacterium]|nr:glycosyltransferase [Gemmatimonadales bacterium]